MSIRKLNQGRIIHITHKGNEATYIGLSARQAIKQFLHTYRG